MTPRDWERLDPSELSRAVAERLGIPPAEYATDIQATWDLIAAMQERGMPLDLTGPQEDEEFWTAGFGAIQARGPTPGAAACLAALLATEPGGEDGSRR